MKIAVLTYPLNNNFGNLLQAWALKKFLTSYGDDVVVFYRKNYFSYGLYLQKYIKSLCLKFLGKQTYLQNSPRRERIYSRNTLRFIKEEIDAQEIHSTSTLYDNLKNFDAVIVGSDQVWRPKFLGKLYRDYFLVDYIKPQSQKILSYAASLGSDVWEFQPDEEMNARRGLICFDAISVRELSAIDSFEEHFSIKSEIMPDPTLLLKASEYITLMEAWTENTENFRADIFCYLLDLTIQEEILLKSYAKKRGLTISFMPSCNVQNEKSVYPDVREWLWWIKNSDLIITNSFHGSVFSLIFEKSFIPIINNKRGKSRIESLLKMFDISPEVKMTTIDELVKQKTINPIINNKHNLDKDFRIKARDFIVCNLNR